MLWSRQVYIIHRSITGFLVVQEATCTHAHEYRLLGASCLLFYFGVTFVHANLCQPANFNNYSKKELQRKTISFSQFPAGIELATSEFSDQRLIHWTTAASLEHLRQKLIFNCQACSQGPRIFSRWRLLFRASSKCLRPVSVMLATATPQSPAMKRPLENLEL